MTDYSIYFCSLPHLKELIAAGTVPSEIAPAYGGESAGLDLYNAGPDLQVLPVLASKINPNNYGNFSDLPEDLRKSIYRTLMPTGIKVAIPSGFVGLILERSSVVKTPFKVRAGVIDSGYTGEVFVNMINISDRPATIRSGEKSPFQLVVVPCNNLFRTCDETAYAELTSKSKRLNGQIGSSDKVN